MEQVLDELCARAEGAVREGVNIIILSDRMAGSDRIPIPSLLACAAVHHHLIRTGLRTSVGLVVESGEPREVHHFACLAGYGAEAINPYLAFETIIAMKDRLPGALDDYEIVKRYIKSIGKGLLKVMSKMGISTYQSYCGAQIFDAVGLKADFVAKYFAGTHTRIEGVGLAEIAEETARRHTDAFGDAQVYKTALDVGGEYAYRTRGEDHAWTAESVSTLQHAVRGNSLERYRAFAKILNEQSERLLTLRGLFRIKTAEDEKRKPIKLDQVEPAKDIVKRFATGAMCVRLDLARGAHHARDRHEPDRRQVQHRRRRRRIRPLQAAAERRFSMRSAIKQVASGRFGVTTEYLVNSDMMQIKMAQGAKPGEGGQLPGHKVDATIARVRHSTPGVGLDFAAAASRHLFDRGSGAADLRPQERQSGRPGLGQAGLRNRRRHGGRGRCESARRPCHHRGLRGRHRRLPAHLDQARRLALGNRPCRNPPDAGARAAAQPHRGPGRRRLPHRARRRDRRAAWAPTSSALPPRR